MRFVRYYNSMGNLRREWSGYGSDPKVSLLASQTGNTHVLNGAAGTSGPKTVYSEAPAPLGQAQLAQAYPFNSPENNTWDKTNGYIGHADRKWRHNYDYYLFIQKSDGSQIIAYRPDGTDIAFKNLQPQIAIAVRLSRLLATDPIAPNGYLYTTENLSKEYYDTQGRILKTINRDGFAHSYTYNAQNPKLLISVSDAFDATISFAYDAENRLAQMITPDGQIYRYSYHPENNLYAAVIYPDDTPANLNDNPKREYLYEDARFPDALTGIDDDGVRYANFAYDHNGRAIMSELGGSMERVDIEYTDNDTRLLSNALGKQTRYEFVNINGSMLLNEIIGEASPNCAATTQRIVYDSLNRKQQTVARDGTITNYGYNTLNQLSTITEAYGTADARSTSYSYDSLGRKISESAPNQGSTSYTLDANGRTIEINRGYQKTRFTYTAQGLLQSVDGPRNNISDTLNYRYDTQGRLSSITDGKGNTTQITAYDSTNRPLTVIDANGISTYYSYHPRGWLASKTTEGATTQFQYDIVGNLVQITQANGDTTHYEYNSAHQLIAIQDAGDNRTEYSRDLLGNITASLYRDAQGTIRYQQQRHYDELGRLTQTSGENGQSTDYGYDLSDNPIQATDALNQSTSYQYDRLGRLKQSTDALNGLTQYQYNQAGWPTKVIDPKGHATLYYYDNDGNITSLNSPNTGNENWTYDLWGGQLTQYWGNGQYWYYTWDANNRLTYHKMGGAGSADDRYYTYDDTANGNYGKNRLTRIQDGSGQTNYRYDAKGQITQLSHNIGPNLYTLSYQYDSTGRVTDIQYPGGAHLIYHYAHHRLSKIEWQNGAQTSTLADNLQYLPFGPLSQLRYGNGLNLNRSFDQDYRLNNQTLSGLENKTYSYTLVDNLAAVQDTQSPAENISYNYDPLSRLSTAQDNNSYQYSYDSVGNRLSETLNSSSTNYLYKTTNQQLTQIGSTTVQHDSYGRITQKGSWTYVYNYYNHRLKEVKYQNQLKASYVYNALGQRTRKILPGNGETQYIYDLDDQLIAEANASGTLQRQYVYLDRQPLALIENGNIYYYHNDVLGTPKKISNALQQIVWQADHTPFGMATMTAASVENNLRFAGQYFDQETGLHYNYFRYYDPSTGRYVTSDPIGLNGGINTYGYAYQNPISNIDPDGLNPFTAARAGWAIGGAINYTIQAATGLSLGVIIYNATHDDSSDKAKDRAIPQSDKPKRGVTCTCRATSSGQQAGNCPEEEFAFGTATAPTAREARAEAERIARKNLGKQAKHTQCKCTDSKGNRSF